MGEKSEIYTVLVLVGKILSFLKIYAPEDEEITPSHEDLILLNVLALIHPRVHHSSTPCQTSPLQQSVDFFFF